MTVDGRGYAWVAAYRCIEQANKFRVDKHDRVVDPLPELYWSLMFEAQAWAKLAQVEVTAGYMAGEFLEQEQKQRDREYEHSQDMLDTILKTRSATVDGCQCAWSRAACPVHPWPPEEGGV